MHTHALVLVGAALAAGALVRTGPELPAEVYTTPPVTADPGALAMVEGFTRSIVGVAVSTTAGPPRTEASGPWPALEDLSPPWRWYAAQKWSLYEARGAASSSSARLRVPRLTVDEILGWLDVWDAACTRWEAAVAGQDSHYLDIFREEVAARRKAIASFRREARRLRTSVSTAFAVDIAARDATQAIATVSVQLSPTATGAVPQPPSVYVSGWAHAGQLVRDYLIGPVEDAAGAALGAAGGLAVRAVGGVLTSPAGAALVLFLGWHYLGRS